MSKCAVIFGVNGQDGAYLAEFLLDKGYKVVGVLRPGGSVHNISGFRDKIVCEYMDDENSAFYSSLIARHSPSEIYIMAAQSHVGRSWDMVAETVLAGALIPARIIEALHSLGGKAKFFQASTASLFGNAGPDLQTENTGLDPCDPYGISKYVPHKLVTAFRERYGYHFCSGICYNHESPRRPYSFVTRNITSAVARITLGKRS